MTETRYRGLLCVYLALSVAQFAAAYFAEYSEALADAYEQSPETWLARNFWSSVYVLGALLVWWLAVLGGLFFLKRWARPLALGLTLLGWLLYPFLGESLSSGLEDSFFEAAATVWGAILALSYFSAVSARFER